MRCERSKRQCPGYRDPFETKIRDETEATINKFSKRPPVGHAGYQWVQYVVNQPGRRQRPELPPEISDWEFERYVNKLGRSLAVPIDQQASCYFLADFVVLPAGPGSFGYHQFIYGLLQRDKILSSFELAFKAVSLMALSRRPNSRSLRHHAQALYAMALKEVNRALQDPSQINDDQILGSVLLLAMYEVSVPQFLVINVVYDRNADRSQDALLLRAWHNRIFQPHKRRRSPLKS